MLKMAGKDLRALHAMLDPETFDEEIFGFHAQQAVEKSLKAWITALGKEHNYKHDLRPLLIKLQDLGCNVADLREFVDPLSPEYFYNGGNFADEIKRTGKAVPI